MLVDAQGQVLRRQTETRFDPRLVQMLIALSDVLNQNGLGLFCMKCHRLGLPDGVKADNRPDDDQFRLTCACAVRTFDKRTGREKVDVQ